MAQRRPATRFTSSSAAESLRNACAQVGLDHRGAQLLRLGENAIYRLSSAPVVVRIARSLDFLAKVEKELRVSRWLAELAFPAARLYEEVGQPLIVDDRPVSFWRFVDQDLPTPRASDLARLLRRLHGLLEPPHGIPEFDPLVSVGPRIQAADLLADKDRDFLLDRCEVLGERYARLGFELPHGLIHGDAHTGNLLRAGGQPILVDFEAVAIGPREWDLVPTAIGNSRFSLSDEDYSRFVAIYGFDVRDWAGYGVLREIREFTMTTWLMQNVGEGDALAEEFRRRVESLREGDLERTWHAF